MMDSRVLDLLEAPCVWETTHGSLEGGGVAVPQALDVSSRALRLPAHRVAQCDHDCTRNSLPPKQ